MKKAFFLVLSVLIFGCNGIAQEPQQKKNYPAAKSDAEWQEQLSSAEYKVLRKKGTERAFSSDLNYIEEAGTFVCAACANPLYETKYKFDSGTGWPSFDRAISNKNVDYRPDRTGGFPATEVVCGKCGGHLGHVFNDGPRNTTGKRHCINGIAMNFIPEQQ